jgi:hypothetical protein
MAEADASRTTGPAALVVSLRTAFVEEGGGGPMMGDADTFVDTLAPHATDDFSSLMEGGALTTRYEGLEGLRAGWQDFLEAFDEIEIVPGELRESPSGDAVVEFVRLVGKPRGVSAAIDQDAAAVWRLRDSKLSGVEFHIDRAAALRAGGLDPAAPGPPVAGT